MKLKSYLKHLFINLKESIARFFTAFVCSVLFFLTISYIIIFENLQFEIATPLCMVFGLTAVFSVLYKLIQEYIWQEFKPVLQYGLCIITGIISFHLIRPNYESIYTILAYTGVMIALVCFIFYVLMRGENRDLAFPKLFTSWIFAGAICTVLSGGLSTCIAAVQSLIFSWNDIYKLYTIVILFVSEVFFVNLFLSFIPKKDVPVTQSKILRAFVLFAGLPLYILLIVILLIYLAKIVVTGDMPIGEINWFASFASLFFIFFLLSVMQYKEKIAKLFVKFGGYFLAPILIMQAVAVFERINAYGLTTPRTISLVLIIISILFIAGSIITPKHLNKISLISGIIVLLVTVTPLNVIDIPIESQTKILKTTLLQNDMLKDGKVIPNPDISSSDAEKIISSYEYLKYNAKKVPYYIKDSNKTMKEIFGFDDINDDDNRIYCDYGTKDTVDISGYDIFQSVRNEDDYTLKINYNDQEYVVDLQQLSKSFYDEYGTSKNDMELYIVNEKVALYIRDFTVSAENDEIAYCHFNGYALIKK